MLKDFRYQRILSETDEMAYYNNFTQMAIEETGSYDTYIKKVITYVNYAESKDNFLDDISLSKLDRNKSLKEIFYPLIESAWKSVFDEYGHYRNCNMKYLKYISTRHEIKGTLLSLRYEFECVLEELVYLYLELTAEYIVDLSVSELEKMGLTNRGHGYVDAYKERLANIINAARETIESKRNPWVNESVKRIRFNPDMFKAILEGRKTTTRRAAKFERRKEFPNVDLYASACSVDTHGYSKDTYCIYQKINSYWNEMTYPLQSKYAIGDILYTDDKEFPSSMLEGRHVIFLKITDVRIERLQEIRYHEVYKEGIRSVDICTHQCSEQVTCVDEQNADSCHVIHAFKDLWNSTIKDSESDVYGWDADPYVFVYDFEVISKKEAEALVPAGLESEGRE